MSQENQNPPVDPIVEPLNPPADPDQGQAAERIKKDLFKYKSEAQQLREENERLKLQTHKEKEDWKTVAEHHETKAKDIESKYTKLQNALVDEKKFSALRAEASKAGINAASIPDLELLDFPELHVETTSTGKILVSGADAAVAKLKTLRPHWFTNVIPSVNSATPNLGRPNGSLVTLADVNAAEAQWSKTKSESDKKIYFETIQKFKAQ